MRVEVTVPALEAGIRAWRARTRWDQQFHASVYSSQASLKCDGLNEEWWRGTLLTLRRWKAHRTPKKVDIAGNGLRLLPDLAQEYEQLLRLEERFGAIEWANLAPLFEVARELKETASPVFPSKLCHLARPDLYMVIDRAAVGLRAPYAEYWEACSNAWRAAAPVHRELRSILHEELDNAPDEFPYATKITELCLMGGGR